MRGLTRHYKQSFALRTSYLDPQNNLNRKDTILQRNVYAGDISRKPRYNEASHQGVGVHHRRDSEDDSQYHSWLQWTVVISDCNQLICRKEKGCSEAPPRVMACHGGLTIYCTQKMDVQEMGWTQPITMRKPALSSKGDEMQSAVRSRRSYTGNGGLWPVPSAEKTGSRLLHHATARRQCGSAIKPISVYAYAG